MSTLAEPEYRSAVAIYDWGQIADEQDRSLGIWGLQSKGSSMFSFTL